MSSLTSLKAQVGVLFLLAVVSLLLATPSWAFADTCGSNAHGSAGGVDANVGRTDGPQDSIPFTCASDLTITSASVELKKAGSPTDNIYAVIYTKVAGKPGVPLATSSAVAGTSLTTSYAYVTFGFSSYALTAGSYMLVLSRDSAMNNTNYYSVRVYSGATATDVYQSSVGSAWLDDTPYGWSDWDVTGTAGGGGGGSTAATSTALSATSTGTIDQAERNLTNAVWLFLAAMSFIIWVFRKK